MTLQDFVDGVGGQVAGGLVQPLCQASVLQRHMAKVIANMLKGSRVSSVVVRACVLIPTQWLSSSHVCRHGDVQARRRDEIHRIEMRSNTVGSAPLSLMNTGPLPRPFRTTATLPQHQSSPTWQKFAKPKSPPFFSPIFRPVRVSKIFFPQCPGQVFEMERLVLGRCCWARL